MGDSACTRTSLRQLGGGRGTSVSFRHTQNASLSQLCDCMAGTHVSSARSSIAQENVRQAREPCTPAGQTHPLAEDAVGSSGDDFADAQGSGAKPATLKWSQALEDRLLEYVDAAKVCSRAALLTQDHLGTHEGVTQSVAVQQCPPRHSKRASCTCTWL